MNVDLPEKIVRPSDFGYVPVLERNELTSAIGAKLNDDDIDELNKMRSKYDELTKQLYEIQKSINDSSLQTIRRVSANNPYLNKNIRFTDGKICYVTNQGIAKPYDDLNTYNSTVGKNRCPVDIVDVSMPWSSSYIKGSSIPTNPSLLVGSNMKIGQSCGNEGQNVYAYNLTDNSLSSYSGCYKNDSTVNKVSLQNIKTNNTMMEPFEKCKQYAMNNSYKYFAVDNYENNCVLTNDITKLTKYDNATSDNRSTTSIWSSNTSGQLNNVQLSGTGQLIIKDQNGNVISTVGKAVSDCSNWGTISVNTATYGGNCKAPIGNVTNKLTNDLKCNFKDSCSIPISNGTFGDPKPGCKKSFDIDYKCGGNQFTRNLAYAEGQTMILDCKQYMQDNCQFYLILQDDGNLCIYKGKEPSNSKGGVWCTMTNGKQKSPNANWSAKNGKYGRNYLKTGETLLQDEWIGSNDGSLKLVMQKDGNLVLYTSEVLPGCKKVNDKKYGERVYGERTGISGFYEIKPTGNRSSLGKMGYIDGDSNLKEYPSNMLTYANSKNYKTYNDMDSRGNDIKALVAKDVNECQRACDALSDCTGYVYQGSSSTCWLKNGKGEKTYNNATILGERVPMVNNSKTCGKNVVNVDTIQYDNYVRLDSMTTNTECNEPIISTENQVKYDNIKNQLVILGNDIASKMEHLYEQDNNIFSKIDINSEQFKKYIDDYKNTNKRIIKSQGIIEGMSNLNMNDVNGMLLDSNLRVVRNNYKYILWSILAIGLLTITVKALKNK